MTIMERAAALESKAYVTRTRDLLPQPESDFDGVAIMLVPRDEDLEALKGYARVEKGHLHTTLTFHGDSDQWVEKGYSIEMLVASLLYAANEAQPIEATLGGMTRFSAPKGNDPIVLSVDSKGVIELRDKVLHALKLIGVEEQTEHGYTPHMTLGYIKKRDRLDVARWQPRKIVFDRIRIGFGGKEHDLPLGNVSTKHLPGQHDQMSHGRRKGVPTSALARLAMQGGFTWDLSKSEAPDSGYVVALKGSSIKPATSKADVKRQLEEFLSGEHRSEYVGGWFDREHNEICLDWVQVVPDRAHAIQLGKENNQQAIFDLNNFEEIDTGGDGDRDAKGLQHDQGSRELGEHVGARARRLAGSGSGSDHGELKGDRYVRTPAGARHYGQPIGSLIVADQRVRVEGVPGFIDKNDPNIDEDFDSRNSWCYQHAAQYAIENSTPEGHELTLQHGFVQISPNVPAINHAWVELADGTAFEPNSGHRMSQEDFDAFFNPTRVGEYDTEEMREMLVEKGHWGPFYEDPNPVTLVVERAMNIIMRLGRLAAKTEEMNDITGKALRRVRTPEGAEHYGQPIGSVIRRDHSTAKRAVLGVAATILAGMAAFGAGAGMGGMSPADIVDRPDAPEVVQVHNPGLDEVDAKPAPKTVQGYRSMFRKVDTDIWGAADVSISHEAVTPSGKTVRVWLYGDTFSKEHGMVASTAIVQDGGNLHVSHDGEQLLPDGPKINKDGKKYEGIFWVESVQGQTDDGNLLITTMPIARGSESVWDFYRITERSRIAELSVTDKGDVNFEGWRGYIPRPALTIDGEDYAEVGPHHFTYQHFIHDIRVEGGWLKTNAQNWDDDFANHIDPKTGELRYEDFRPQWSVVDSKDLPYTPNELNLPEDQWQDFEEAVAEELANKADRYVRTPAGVRRFNKPIGALITDSPDELPLGLPDPLRDASPMDKVRVQNKLPVSDKYKQWSEAQRQFDAIADMDMDDWRAQQDAIDRFNDQFKLETEPDNYGSLPEQIANGPWTRWNPCRQIRNAAWMMLGYDTTFPNETRSDPSLGYYTPGGDDYSNTDHNLEAVGLLDGIHEAVPSPRTFYRGVKVSDPDKFIEELSRRDTFDLPLASFTDYRPHTERFGTDVTFALQRGSKGVKGGSMGPPPHMEEDHPDYIDYLEDEDNFYEYVTGGRFRIMRTYKTEKGYTVVIRQIGTFDPRTGLVKGEKPKPPDFDWMFNFPLAQPKDRKQEKADRYVRTAAGARRYGQPIGSLIVADPVPTVKVPNTPKVDKTKKAKDYVAAAKKSAGKVHPPPTYGPTATTYSQRLYGPATGQGRGARGPGRPVIGKETTVYGVYEGRRFSAKVTVKNGKRSFRRGKNADPVVNAWLDEYERRILKSGDPDRLASKLSKEMLNQRVKPTAVRDLPPDVEAIGEPRTTNDYFGTSLKQTRKYRVAGKEVVLAVDLGTLKADGTGSWTSSSDIGEGRRRYRWAPFSARTEAALLKKIDKEIRDAAARKQKNREIQERRRQLEAEKRRKEKERLDKAKEALKGQTSKPMRADGDLASSKAGAWIPKKEDINADGIKNGKLGTGRNAKQDRSPKGSNAAKITEKLWAEIQSDPQVKQALKDFVKVYNTRGGASFRGFGRVNERMPSSDAPMTKAYVEKVVKKVVGSYSSSSADMSNAITESAARLWSDLKSYNVHRDSEKYNSYKKSHRGLFSKKLDPFYWALLRSVYETTQEDLKRRGVKSVRATRGMNGTRHTKNKTVMLKSQAITSWSVNPRIAQAFGGTQFWSEIPANRVLSFSWGAGMGEPSQGEILVLGSGAGDYAFAMSSDDARKLLSGRTGRR